MLSLRIMLEYFHPWPNSAGFYLARERGWYAEAGLDVELCVPDPERGDSLQHVLQGAAHLSVFPSNRLLVRRDLGQPLRGVAAINHAGLEAFQTLSELGIQRPRDLMGKRLAMNPTPRGLAMVRDLVRKDGGDPDAVIIVDAGARELRPEELEAGLADASFGGYWAWEALMDSPVAAQRRVVHRVSDWGAPAYHSYLLGAREDWIQANAHTLRAFLAATARGFHCVAEAPALARAAYERVIPYFPRTLIEQSLTHIAPTWLHQNRWGVQRQALVEPYAHWLHQHGIVQNPQAWESAITNDYLPVEAP
ncbi:MAG: ABC transporter substrate-binding protein [Pseudomonas sp.]|uniref:ABC transporter substrate-binding protein n=1 Tax=Pseudomonas abieticivorans TaxID=2931382 RepID=UPI0020C0225D|nr:ABC transporter substrate-binding protein [Pseudomonas sp. PIA16]MDE1169449.1 ABC transporter substrate-binding protein [Pseudomonas sp.]